MGIMDKVAALMPPRGARQHQLERRAPHTQALALKDDFDRWLQRLFDEQGGYAFDYLGPSLPRIRESGDQVIVTAEVPGFDPDDLDLSITPQGLVIRAERQQGDETRRLLETVTLPEGLDLDAAEARVERGVLTVTFPRTSPPQSRGRRIPVNAGAR